MKKILAIVIALSFIISSFPTLAADDGFKLDEYKDIHPRLYVSEYETLKNNINNDERMKKLFDIFIEKTDEYVESEPTKYYEEPSNEDLWMRKIGDKIGDMVFAYRMTDDKKYFEAAKKWAFNSIDTYPTWGRENAADRDLSAAHMVVGISMLYDWCFDELTKEEKEKITNKFQICASRIPSAWYKGSYMQNHLWHSATSMMLMGIATYNEVDGAKSWIDWANSHYEKTFSYLTDGATHEGLLYWHYGIRPIVTYVVHAKKYFGLDYTKNPYIQNGWEYVLHSTLPFKDYKDSISVFNFGDCSQKGVAHDTFSYLSYFSKVTGNKVAQYVANRFADYCIESKYDAGWHSFVFYNYGMEEESLEEADVPLFKDFPDLHYIYMRSGWDKNASAVATRCGPVLGLAGAKSTYRYDLGTGHTHSDVGHVSLWANGEWLLPDDGYVRNSTAQHNTLLVNGKGQIGDFGQWTKDDTRAIPTVDYEYQDDNLCYVVLNCTESYPKNLGLLKFKRHLIYLKSGALILLDDIKGDSAKEFELRFHPAGQTAFKQSDNNYVFVGENTKYAIKPVPGYGATDSFEPIPQFSNKTGGKITKNTICIRKKSDSFIQPTIITWGNKKDRIKSSDIVKKDNDYSITINNECININTEENTISSTRTDGSTTVKYNNKIIDFTAPPVVINGRILVPYTKLIDAMNLYTSFDNKSNVLTFKKSDKEVKMKLLSDTIYVNGKEEKIDSCPMIKNGSVYIPLRAICESLGLNIIYDPVSDLCDIRKDLICDTGILGVFVGPNPAVSKDGKNFETTYMGYGKPEISVIPKSNDATIEIVSSDEKFGKNIIRIKTPDGKDKEEYVLNIKETKGLGDIPITSLSYSSDDGNIGENTVDGDLSTRWSANGVGQWILYDLGEEKDIAKIGIAFSQGSRRKAFLDIQVSDDGENFRTVKSVESSGTTDEIEDYVFENKIKTRYVRFLGKGNSSSKWNSITETAFFSEI